jgi:hypothetical protein
LTFADVVGWSRVNTNRTAKGDGFAAAEDHERAFVTYRVKSSAGLVSFFDTVGPFLLANCVEHNSVLKLAVVETKEEAHVTFLRNRHDGREIRSIEVSHER